MLESSQSHRKFGVVWESALRDAPRFPADLAIAAYVIVSSPLVGGYAWRDRRRAHVEDEWAGEGYQSTTRVSFIRFSPTN